MSVLLPRWFAHRGGGVLAPENTLAGIRLAARLGYEAVEFDVMLSGDGTPVLIHDETLERTTNGKGPVAETPDAVLFSLDAGHGERIPRFVEAAVLCREIGLLANVEIKPSSGQEIRTAEVVARLTGEVWAGAAVQPLLSSFSPEAVAIARDVVPHIRRGMLFETPPEDWLVVCRRLAATSLHCDANCITEDMLSVAIAHNIPVLCYTVNEQGQARKLFDRGVSGLFTDRLDVFMSETQAYKGLHLVR